MREKIVIAGATGFIGRSLIEALGPRQPIIGLSRSSREPLEGHRNIEWRACDLMKAGDTERALAGATTAVYLVHSMMPQNALIRGSFADIDLICADNFARAAEVCGVRHIVYLSGLVPDEAKLSRHLASRLEVEQTFEACDVPATTLRAGMVVGAGGSSFLLMSRLVDRLPFIVAPRWTQSKSQSVALADVVKTLVYSLEHPKDSTGTWDIGGPDVLTYREMLEQTAEVLGKKPRIIDIPFNPPALSHLGVSLVTGTPRQLVAPLMQSLQHAMVARQGHRLQARAGLQATPFKQAVRDAVAQDPPKVLAGKPRRRLGKATRTALCMQRMAMPPGVEALWAARDCARWLPAFVHPRIHVERRNDRVYRLGLAQGGPCLLELTFWPERSSDARQIFYMSGGLLVRPAQLSRERLEFRGVLGNHSVLLMVDDTVPRAGRVPHKAAQAAFQTLVLQLFSPRSSEAAAVA